MLNAECPVRLVRPAATLNFSNFFAPTKFTGEAPLRLGGKALFASLKIAFFGKNFKQESCTIIDKHRQSSRFTIHLVIR